MQKIIIVGAGFAGVWSALAAARALDEHGKSGAVEIEVIAPEPFLHIRPRLYEAQPHTLKAPLRELFDATGVCFRQGRITRLEPLRNMLQFEETPGASESLHYDKLILAAGSTLFLPDIPGLKEHAFNVDQMAAAVALEQHLQQLAMLPDTPARNTVVIAGGGFTGIETAAEMTQRLREHLGETVRPEVIIVEQAAAIGPDLGPGPRPVIEQALRSLGVRWHLNKAVTAVTGSGVTLAGGVTLAAGTVVWTGGARANPLAAQIPAERDRHGRLIVDGQLRVPGCNDVFATGDMARAPTDAVGNATLMSCQHALSLGRVSGYNAVADLLGAPAFDYRQPKYVTCLDLGPWGAVYTEGWERAVKLQGAEAKDLKRMINTQWIYPPAAERTVALSTADPGRVIVA